MTTTLGVARIGVGVHDVETMARFYGETLGFPLHRHDLGFAIRAGGVGVGFFRVTGARGPERSVAHFLGNPTGVDHLVFGVADLPAQLARLREAQIEADIDDPLASDADRAAGRLTLVRFRDPEGNLVGLTAGPDPA